MVLQSQPYPQVGYAYTYGDEHYKNGYQHQDDYYSKHGYAQQQDYCSENAYYNSGSSMQQVKPYPNIATPHHHEVGYQGYGQQHSINGDGYGNHHKYNDYNSHGYDKHSTGKHHMTDGLYGKLHGYDHHDNHGYPAGYPNGPSNTYETVSSSYYAEGRVRHPTSCQHLNQQNWPSNAAQWIAKSLDD
ncbi:uncharacterized protein LOC113752742 [Coffea eugenioides]|uniref:uncharacterized protein LOC113752742 n=1 Tax=Coffea eugenioides TaxID=49369 RepID=UPI000F6158E6|nr:uncharacterized protein LOC113752742 [Coffea eugenioides]